eukprot:11494655-Alexandrium_andersonii.AAC.1
MPALQSCLAAQARFEKSATGALGHQSWPGLGPGLPTLLGMCVCVARLLRWAWSGSGCVCGGLRRARTC